MSWMAFSKADRFPCKTAIFVLKFVKIDNLCLEDKSIFHFFHILANKISRIIVFRVVYNAIMSVLPACSAIPQRIGY
jgi:hypothetical protein